MKSKRPAPKKKISLKQLIVFTLITLLGLSIVTGIVLTRSTQATTTHMVTLTSHGFYPPQLKIRAGDSITFTTNTNNTFWPASNVHPHHTMFPAFDPKEQIPPQDSWTFTFNKEGIYPFHDHLHPFFTGVVTVLAKNGNDISFSCDAISQKSEAEKLRCWEDMIDSEITTKGIGPSLDLLANTYTTDPLFSKNCHYYTHKIGEAAYKKFREQQDFDLSEKTTYCGFGFYHGFVDAMAILDKDLSLAQAFCDYVDTRLAKEKGTLASGPCYHGIGHGIVDGADKKVWGDAEAMIKPGLAFCQKISRDRQQLYGCATGVFNSLSIAYWAKTFEMKIDEKDPLWICRKQMGIFKEACYPQMMVVIHGLVGDDIQKAESYLATIPEEEHAIAAMENISSLIANQKLLKANYDDEITMCHTLSTRFSHACIIGFVSGLIEFGNPQLEYKKSLAFCNNAQLSTNEKDACHEHILSYLAYLYSKDKFTTVCSMVPEEYKTYCDQE